MTLRTMAAVAAAAAACLGVAACGDDDNDDAGTPAATTAAPAPVAQIDALDGQTTAVKLDSGFVDALTQLKVTPAAVGDGEITEEGSAVFPITGGNVTYYEPGSISPYVQGEIDHEDSGLSLTAGDTVVELTDFVIDPGKSVLTGTVSVDGEVAAESAPLFFLDGRTLEPLKTEGDTAILEGTTVKLKAEAADLLNQTFGIDDLQEGMVIGVAKITVNTQ